MALKRTTRVIIELRTGTIFQSWADGVTINYEEAKIYGLPRQLKELAICLLEAADKEEFRLREGTGHPPGKCLEDSCWCNVPELPTVTS